MLSRYPVSIGSYLILRPFAHRAVVEREIVVAEPVELQQIHRRGNAAAAIGDDALVFGDAGAGEFLFGFRERQEGFRVRIDQRRRRHVDAAGNAARPAITARLQSLVELRPQRVDDDGVAIGAGVRAFRGCRQNIRRAVLR